MLYTVKKSPIDCKHDYTCLIHLLVGVHKKVPSWKSRLALYSNRIFIRWGEWLLYSCGHWLRRNLCSHGVSLGALWATMRDPQTADECCSAISKLAAPCQNILLRYHRQPVHPHQQFVNLLWSLTKCPIIPYDNTDLLQRPCPQQYRPSSPKYRNSYLERVFPRGSRVYFLNGGLLPRTMR